MIFFILQSIKIILKSFKKIFKKKINKDKLIKDLFKKYWKELKINILEIKFKVTFKNYIIYLINLNFYN